MYSYSCSLITHICIQNKFEHTTGTSYIMLCIYMYGWINHTHGFGPSPLSIQSPDRSQSLHCLSYVSTQPTLYMYLCRIDENFVIKVSDFGLSEDIYARNYFRQGTLGEEGEAPVKLPVRWMAVESLNDRIFTEKTDVVSVTSCLNNSHTPCFFPHGQRATPPATQQTQLDCIVL